MAQSKVKFWHYRKGHTCTAERDILAHSKQTFWHNTGHFSETHGKNVARNILHYTGRHLGTTNRDILVHNRETFLNNLEGGGVFLDNVYTFLPQGFYIWYNGTKKGLAVEQRFHTRIKYKHLFKANSYNVFILRQKRFL